MAKRDLRSAAIAPTTPRFVLDGDEEGELAAWRHALATATRQAPANARSSRRLLLAYEDGDVEDEREPLGDEAQSFLDAALALLSDRLGRASLRYLGHELEGALLWAERHHDPQRGPFEALGWALVQRKLRLLRGMFGGRSGLYVEWLDEKRRREALSGGESLARYLKYTKRTFDRARVAYPSRWRVPGYNTDELYDSLESFILERLDDPEAWEPYERPGRAATYVILDRERRARRSRALSRGWNG